VTEAAGLLKLDAETYPPQFADDTELTRKMWWDAGPWVGTAAVAPEADELYAVNGITRITMSATTEKTLRAPLD